MDNITVIRASTKVSVVADEPTRWNCAVDRLTISVICRTSQILSTWPTMVQLIAECPAMLTCCNDLCAMEKFSETMTTFQREEPSQWQQVRAFSALTLLVGRQEGHLACKNWAVWCWCGYLPGASSRPAYGPVMPLPLTVSCSRLVLPFWYQITRVVLDKEPFYVCVCVWQQTWRSTESSLIGLSTSTRSRTHWPLFLIPYPNFPATQRTAGQKQSPCNSFNVMIEHQPVTDKQTHVHS